MNRSDCMAMLAIAGTVYAKRIGDQLVDVWMEFMHDVAPSEGVRAMKVHVAESTFFPTIADIRTRVGKERAGEVNVGEAWEHIRKAVSYYGRYKAPVFENKAVGRAVEALGWREICDTLEPDVPTLRAQFERYYRGFVEMSQKQANAGSLIGARKGPAQIEIHRDRPNFKYEVQMEASKANPDAYQLLADVAKKVAVHE